MLSLMPEPPYVAVIFTSVRSSHDQTGYVAMADEMERLGSVQPGFLGIDSARNVHDRLGITTSYWVTEEDARSWKAVAEHLAAQRLGRDRWYERYTVRIATVTREYEFERDEVRS
jgi:heme-degrading monooxygenase HmoA